jgi:hypothetical protein
MSNVLRVLWTIAPQIAPRPWLHCNRCGGARPFRSSAKFRVNANGKRLDAWLVYNCVTCGNSWNRAIFERRNLRHVDPLTLRALEANASDLARQIAFDVEDLRGGSERVEEFAAVRMEKQVLSQGLSPIATMEIVIVAPLPSALRVDRLLAAEFAVSRSRIHALEAEGRLTLSPFGSRMLRRPIKDRMLIGIAVSATEHDLEFGRAAGRAETESSS